MQSVGSNKNDISIEKPRHEIKSILGVVYLIVVAVGVFLFKNVQTLALMFTLQLIINLFTFKNIRRVLQPVKKLFAFSLFVIISYTLLGDESIDRTNEIRFHLPWLPFSLSQSGFFASFVMILRVLLVVNASSWVRAILPEGALVGVLRRLYVPDLLSQVIDRAFFLLSRDTDGGERRGRGDGSGGGHGRNHKKAQSGLQPLTFKRLFQGDVSVFTDSIARAIQRATASQPLQKSEGRDVAVLAGLLVIMLGLKALKILPGLPFAPGHKGVLLIPIYLLAPTLTQTRFAGTVLGSSFGLISFLFGDGKYGIFEILKHITPGILADLTAPFFRKTNRSLFWFIGEGILLAAGRFLTIVLVLMLVQVQKEVFAALIPVALIHLFFGGVGGMVARGLLGARERLSKHD